MMRILLGVRCPVVINEKPFFLLGGGVPRWYEYIIFSYFLCRTFGIWKKACPFISGTKGSVKGHVDLEVNTSHVFSRMELRSRRSHSPGLFILILTVYQALTKCQPRSWCVTAVHASSHFILARPPEAVHPSVCFRDEQAGAWRGVGTSPRFRARKEWAWDLSFSKGKVLND